MSKTLGINLSETPECSDLSPEEMINIELFDPERCDELDRVESGMYLLGAQKGDLIYTCYKYICSFFRKKPPKATPNKPSDGAPQPKSGDEASGVESDNVEDVDNTPWWKLKHHCFFPEFCQEVVDATNSCLRPTATPDQCNGSRLWFDKCYNLIAFENFADKKCTHYRRSDGTSKTTQATMAEYERAIRLCTQCVERFPDWRPSSPDPD
jgi:hypothetical protein